MSKNLNDLIDDLFDVLQGLKSGDLTVEQARAASAVGQVIVNTAKIEVDYIKATGGDITSGFIDVEPILPKGINSITTHRIK